MASDRSSFEGTSSKPNRSDNRASDITRQRYDTSPRESSEVQPSQANPPRSNASEVNNDIPFENQNNDLKGKSIFTRAFECFLCGCTSNLTKEAKKDLKQKFRQVEYPLTDRESQGVHHTEIDVAAPRLYTDDDGNILLKKVATSKPKYTREDVDNRYKIVPRLLDFGEKAMLSSYTQGNASDYVRTGVRVSETECYEYYIDPFRGKVIAENTSKDDDRNLKEGEPFTNDIIMWSCIEEAAKFKGVSISDFELTEVIRRGIVNDDTKHTAKHYLGDKGIDTFEPGKKGFLGLLATENCRTIPFLLEHHANPSTPHKPPREVKLIEPKQSRHGKLEHIRMLIGKKHEEEPSE